MNSSLELIFQTNGKSRVDLLPSSILLDSLCLLNRPEAFLAHLNLGHTALFRFVCFSQLKRSLPIEQHNQTSHTK